MSKIILRDYQQNVVDKIRRLLSSNYKHILAQLPTGGGKTIIFSYITQNAVAKNRNVLIITDRSELLMQAGGTIKQFNLNPYYIKAGSKFIDHRKNVFIAMSQTLRNRVDKPEWIDWINKDVDLIIIDEAHIQEFNYLFESDVLKNKIVLGFTATPVRTGKMRQLGLDYERMVRGTDVKELVKKGFLVNCDTYDCGSPSMDGVKFNAKTGDYSNDSMFKKFDSPTLYKGLLKNYEKYTPGQKMIVFCCNVEHAIKTTLEFINAGYNAKFIASKKSVPKKPKDGATQGEVERYNERLRVYNVYLKNYEQHSGTRKQIIDGFNSNKFEILINVDILTKGFDCPDIEVVALYRATTSLALYLQMVGRGSRISDGKGSFTLFDFGGNVHRLGNYDDSRNWSLWHESSKRGSGVPPLKECGITNNGKDIIGGGNIKKGCKRLIMASMSMCPFCGFKYPVKDESKEIELKLASITDENGVSLSVKNFKDMDYYELKSYRQIKKHHQAWLWRQLWIRGKENELRRYASFDRWSNTSLNRAISYCKNKFN